jgi:hypothetical protein
VNRTLRKFGRNWHDYFHLKERANSYSQLVLTNNSLILQELAIKSLQALLVDFPDWEIVISVANRESESEDVRKWGYEWPTSEVVIRDDEIIDALDRENLPLEFRDLVIEGSRPPDKLWDDAAASERLSEKKHVEPSELYKRIKLVLQQYGTDDIRGGDYFLLDEKSELYLQEVEIHQLHMLRPEIIQSLQRLLLDYPDWKIDVSIYTLDGKIGIGPPPALTICSTEIIDALDRRLLPREYQDFVYAGSRPPETFAF